jgi:hypothetical protein
MDVVWYTAGALVVLVTGTSILFTLVLPRATGGGIERITLSVNRIVRLVFIGLARVTTSYERKDALLSPTGPVALVAQLVAWAAMFILGFAFLLEPTTHDFGAALRQSAAALFTVGQVHAGPPPNVTADITAGAIWAVIVALQIAYLPALYASFNRRESLVAMLESRAGVPAWGPEVLARHQLVGITDALPQFYAQWEGWAAEVAESHTTYPVLLLFRSPVPWFSWVLGLLAVLDGAAMHLAVAPHSASSQARLCLRMGFTAFNRIAATLGWEIDPDPNPEGPIELTYEEFEQAFQMLVEVGFATERSAEEAWPEFRGWRVNYEKVAYRLADRSVAPPAPWSGPRKHLPSGPVAPLRPPQRSPGKPDKRALGTYRPTVVVQPTPRRRVRS